MERVYTYTQTDQEVFENIFSHENLLMNHVVVPPHKTFPKHPTDASVYVLIAKGTLRLGIEEKEPQFYGIGQVVHIPKGVVSELGNDGDVPLELFVVKHQL